MRVHAYRFAQLNSVFVLYIQLTRRTKHLLIALSFPSFRKSLNRNRNFVADVRHTRCRAAPRYVDLSYIIHGVLLIKDPNVCGKSLKIVLFLEKFLLTGLRPFQSLGAIPFANNKGEQ